MNRPNRNQIEQELIDANRMYYGSTIEDEYHKRLEKYVDYLESKVENLAIADVSEAKGEQLECECFLPERKGRYTDLKNICAKCGKRIAF